MAGDEVTTVKGKKTAEFLRRYCNAKLPHLRFSECVDVKDCPNALRLESVYVVDMHQIPEGDQDGK